ncbi:fasciclin-like arabinogalactan protein 11 [Dorcoceras hygrometricum]|uniref:Fasciclin-like arabinogalactan protein 11 n=1 Tax=Dorcoceras hygrometricum TaxID=472368 RepID=A0A2Z7DK20_9LAMI|nr:fasciclin-like arabinogalactan protein 11 [Dorcoceras hygrometricum]
MKPNFSPLPLLFLLLPSTPSFAQSPAAAPAPPRPNNVTAILEKASQFTTFIHLLQTTKVAGQINTQLINSNQGLTIFAPTDNAFSSLKPGTLNSFTDEQKVELVQFHVVPSFFSPSQFQTVSNPLRTQAGGSEGAFPLNVTANGNQVNITTGVTNATLASSVYSDSQLAVYQVDQVLLPLSFFQSPPPAPAPEKSKKSTVSPDYSSGSGDGSPTDSSGEISLSKNQFFAFSSIVLVLSCTFLNENESVLHSF